jgi:quercetin dioxygenase-like cupin family protein
MRSIPKRLAVVVLVGAFFLMWRAQTNDDVVVAQTRKPIMVTRIYTGSDGLSHAEEIEMKLTTSGAAGVSEMIKATGVQFRRTPPGTFSDWHVGPRRQFVITLSGRGEIEVAGGKKIALEPGRIELIEDTTGKGHTTRAVGTEDRISIAIPLADQTLGSALR